MKSINWKLTALSLPDNELRFKLLGFEADVVEYGCWYLPNHNMTADISIIRLRWSGKHLQYDMTYGKKSYSGDEPMIALKDWFKDEIKALKK